MVLARILLPTDYGLVGMAAVLTAFIQVFSDAGLAWATIQRENLQEAQVHNLFWLNVVLGVTMTLVTAVASPGVSLFFEREELVAIVSVLGIAFLLSGPSVQPLALLKRQMKFKALAGIEFVALLLAATVGIVSAVLGAGYWALVLQSLAGVLMRTVLAFVVSGYCPDWPKRGVGTMTLVNFGGQMAVYGILVYLSRNLDNILIGKIRGAEELGYYGRAYFLMLLPSMLAMAVVGSVMVPALSRLQSDRERFGAAYRQALQAVAIVAIPAAVGVGFCASGFVTLVYGPNWDSVVPILVWLAVAGATQPIYNSYGWLYTAVGDGAGALRWGLVSTSVLALAFGVGVRWGAIGVAVAYAVAMGVVLTIPALFLAHRSVLISFRSTLKSLSPIVAATAAMAAALACVGVFLNALGWPWQVEFVIKVAIGIAAYAIAIRVFMGKEPLTLVNSIFRIQPEAGSTSAN
jgi:PST family polysaccharide transporter